MTRAMIGVWFGLEARRRRRSLAVLALLVAFATATVFAAVAGARRGDTALDRLRAITLPADVIALPNDPKFDWTPVRAIPEVAALSGIAIAPFFIDDVPGLYGYLPPVDDVDMRGLERPVVFRGRIPDPAKSDEIAITEGFSARHGKDVGDQITLRLLSAEQAEDPNADWYHPEGPKVAVRVVGVIRSPLYSDQISGDYFTSLAPSAGLFTRYPANFIGAHQTYGFINALVRLKRGAADIEPFRRHLAEVTGRSDIELMDLARGDRHRDDVIGFQSASFLGFGLAALVAALVLVGQSISRFVAAGLGDLTALRACGLTPRLALAMCATPPVVAAAAGAVLGVAGGVAVSPLLPIGAAALVEPAPGFDVDVPAVVVALIAVPLITLAAALATGALTQFASRSGATRSRSAAAAGIARLPVPVPVVVGTRFALESRSGVPVRPALVGAITGVLGVLAVFTFSAGVADAAENPARFGMTYELEAAFGEAGNDWGPTAAALELMGRDPDVAGVSEHRVGVLNADKTSVTVYSFDAAAVRRVPVVMTDGRLPNDVDEVALGPTTAKALSTSVGSTVTLSGRPMKVTGIGFVVVGAHNDYDDGGWITPAAFSTIFGSKFKYHMASISLRPGADPEAVMGRLAPGLGALKGGGDHIVMAPTEPPVQIAELRDLRQLPILLGVCLALLAVGAVGHALATAVWRRRHEVAVMRALGMTRGQARGVVVTQATVLAVIGLAFGVPLGLALGRMLWRITADRAPLFYEPPMAVLALALIGPVALAVANLLAVWPGRRAARLHIGHILRTE
ncbi:ABC transporter permease [Streptosporangiaceae bacterium NEAU-GS5]|nr:ABC transporter permease [Streptosporangiaceae bacterium NEAU-GS5]